MLSVDLHRAHIVDLNLKYVKKIMHWKGIEYQTVANIIKVPGFKHHNWLVDINCLFSNNPSGMLFDRTQSVVLPLNLQISRPWSPPQQQVSLHTALGQRVEQLCNLDVPVNLFWSGGIDSTTVVAAFLLNAKDRHNIRIFYSPFSVYEHPEYLEFLRTFDDIELIDLSGTVYLTQMFDGIFVTGDGGDEFMASLDESFFQTHGRDLLDQSWQDFFSSRKPDADFIDFCHQYFSLAQRPISTVLEARWFFYAMCKTRFQLNGKLDLFVHYDNFDPGRLVGFFDCQEFENYIYWNLDHIIPGPNYRDWKLPFKQYCLEFDGLENYYRNKQKQGSGQTHQYANKNRIMHNARSIFLLEDGQRITTPSLPLLSQKEYETCYGQTLDYLFNELD